MKNVTRLSLMAIVCGLILGGVWSDRRVSATGGRPAKAASPSERPEGPLVRLAPATIRPGQLSATGRPNLDSLVRSYSITRIETSKAVLQARKSGNLSLVIANRPMDLNLQLNDLRAPGYIAEEIQADGSRRQLPPQPVRTWRGTVAGMPKAEARFTLDENLIEGIIFDEDEWFIVEPLSHYDESAAPSDFVTYRRSDLIEQSFGTCGATLAQEVQTQAKNLTSQPNVSGPVPNQIQWRIEIATDADSDYVTALGNSDAANAEIQTIINQVSGIYQQQVLLSFSIVRQVTRTTPGPYTSTDAPTLLSALQNEWNTNFTSQNRDLVHLFTGKNTTFQGNPGIVGLAFVGTVCKLPTFSYGFSERIDTTPQKFVLTSHEIGHNLGANHPDLANPPVPACDGSIMNSSLVPGTTFCDFSKGEISGFVAIPANSACLTQVQNTCVFTPSATSGNFTTAGGSMNITITTDSVCNWTSYAQVPWITVNSPAGQVTGNGAITFTVASNAGGYSRIGSIVAAGNIVTINQAGDLTCPATPINFNQPVNANLALSDCTVSRQINSACGLGSRTFDQYQFSGVAGQRVSFAVTAANQAALDTYLLLVGPNGQVVAENDDAVSGSFDSRIPASGFFTLPQTGTYTVEVTSCFAGQIGNYTLTAQRQKNASTPGQFRPSNGFVYVRNTNDTGFADREFFYGVASDVPVAGDWDGDGLDSIGIYRNGTFFLRNSNTSGFADIQFPFGAPGDIPIVGDWDGDGVDTVGIVRGNTIFLRNSNTSGNADIQFNYGNSTDIFITGDWNGDGVDTIGCFRPTNGFVYIRNSNTTGIAESEFFYGLAGDRPVVGDWNGDGIDTIGIVRGNQWFLRNSNSSGFADIQFFYGNDTDTPIAGDWNGIQ